MPETMKCNVANLSGLPTRKSATCPKFVNISNGVLPGKPKVPLHVTVLDQIFCGKHTFFYSTPLASKVHCSINGLENSSSSEYSQVQQLFGIAVGLFAVGVGHFLGTFFKSNSDVKESNSFGHHCFRNQKEPLFCDIFCHIFL